GPESRGPWGRPWILRGEPDACRTGLGPAQTWGPLAHRHQRATGGNELHCSLQSADAVVQGRELHADLAEEASGLEPTVRAGAGRGPGAAGGHGDGGGGQWSGSLNRN